MDIQQGVVYWFIKSGNQVRAIEPIERKDGTREWVVERVSGESAGKRMLVPEMTLVQSIN
jgi:hypothetical protein